MTTKHLVLGGARSGKSAFAERCALQIAKDQNKQLVYVATAEAGDEEMRQRIERHQSDRDDLWLLTEQPLHLAQVLTQANTSQCLLVDCLTLWLSNCLHQNKWPEQKFVFIQALSTCPADIILVSNEVGSGVIPMGELSRTFVDELGWLHQEVAQICNNVNLIVAGLPVKLK